MKNEIILIGGGGHCKSCIDVIEQEDKYRIAGIVDVQEKLNQKVLGYKIIATDNDLQNLSKQFNFFFITVGQIKSPSIRIKLFMLLKNINVRIPKIISPYAYISNNAQVGEGTICMHHSMINASAKIGANCIINSKALVEHDAIIHDHCHIATGAILNGEVCIGKGSFIGSNSVCVESAIVKPYSFIESNIKIGKKRANHEAITTNK